MEQPIKRRPAGGWIAGKLDGQQPVGRPPGAKTADPQVR
jgi:hypothetical protein